MEKVLMMIITVGITFDDRLRKECVSLVELGYQPRIIALEEKNTVEEGSIAEGPSYSTVRLLSRKWFSSKRFLALKSLELFTKFTLKVLQEPKSHVWTYSMEMMPMIPILYVLKKVGLVRKIIWDQRELPSPEFLESKTFLFLYRLCIFMSDAIIEANEERRKHLEKYMSEDFPNKSFVLENICSPDFSEMDSTPLPAKTMNWLNGDNYFLAQCGAHPGRNFEYLAEAIIKADKKLIILGAGNKYLEEKCIQKFGKRFAEHVLTTGMLPPSEMVGYIDNALASIILYNQTALNSWLCAPNRLYQALARGVPVIVGKNPPMANLVNEYDFGVVLESDGRDIEDIILKLRKLIDNRNKYRKNAQKNKYRLNWNRQTITIQEIMK